MIRKGSFVKYRNRYFTVESSDNKYAYITPLNLDQNRTSKRFLYVSKQQLTELKMVMLRVSEFIVQNFISGNMFTYDVPNPQYKEVEGADIVILANTMTKSKVALMNFSVQKILHSMTQYKVPHAITYKAPFVKLMGCGVISSFSGAHVDDFAEKERKRLILYAKKNYTSVSERQ